MRSPRGSVPTWPSSTRSGCPEFTAAGFLAPLEELWYTATRLRPHAGELGLAARALAEAADTARAAIRDRFACPGPFGDQWAYETDGRWLARPWFAWPGATLAALALGAWTTGLGEASDG